jgi:acyl carrier protein
MRQTAASRNGSFAPQVSASEVRELVAMTIGEPVTDDLDLIAAGVIDSFGFLELVAAVEDALGMELDLEGLAAEDLTVVGPFCRYVAAAAEREGPG